LASLIQVVEAVVEKNNPVTDILDPTPEEKAKTVDIEET